MKLYVLTLILNPVEKTHFTLTGRVRSRRLYKSKDEKIVRELRELPDGPHACPQCEEKVAEATLLAFKTEEAAKSYIENQNLAEYDDIAYDHSEQILPLCLRKRELYSGPNESYFIYEIEIENQENCLKPKENHFTVSHDDVLRGHLVAIILEGKRIPINRRVRENHQVNADLVKALDEISVATLNDAKAVDETINSMQQALNSGADINTNIPFSCFSKISELLFTENNEPPTNQQMINLKKLIYFMIKKKIDLNKALHLKPVNGDYQLSCLEVAIFSLAKLFHHGRYTPSHPLDQVLPSFDSTDIKPHLELMQLLFSHGAYEINDKSVSRFINEPDKNLFINFKEISQPDIKDLKKLLSKIKLVKDIQKLVIDELRAEYNRLDLKDFAGFNSGYDDYSKRRNLYAVACEQLETAVQQYRKGKIDEAELLREGEKAIRESLPDDQLDKYKDVKGRRHFMNVLTVIFTGILPGVIKYAFTGHLFWSTTGKTQETAEKVRARIKELRKPYLEPGGNSREEAVCRPA